jgi:hypothetical protein
MESSMSRRDAIGFALLACAFATRASADTVDASVTTLLAGHQDPRDGRLYTVVPAYEMVSLVADLQPPHLDGLRAVASGWGMVAFGDPRERTAGDLDVAYLEASALKRRVTLRLGRQIVVGGAARVTQVDGAVLDVKLEPGLGITVYGGAPVTPRFGLSRGDGLGGGRLYWRPRWDSELGVSFIQVQGQGRIARQDGALDARWAPLPSLTLTGYGLMSLKEVRLVEGTLAVAWSPLSRLTVAAEYRRTAPELFLPLNSIFSVFAQTTRDEAGANAWVALARVRLYGDYHLVSDPSGIGHRAGLKGIVGLGQDSHATLGAELRLFKLPYDEGYFQARLFAVERWGAWIVSLDGDTYLLDKAINGQTLSFTAAGTVGWDFAPSWRAVVTGIADVTPFVSHRFEVVAKLAYNFTVRFREVHK